MTSEQRHQAESVFLEFRSTKNPYQLCREILEKSSSDYVLFEAAGLLKAALIREWSLLSENDISSLREYLLNYLLRKEAPPFLREKLLQVILFFSILLCFYIDKLVFSTRITRASYLCTSQESDPSPASLLGAPHSP